MAYTPDAEDTAQPTGNQALSTAALEFRTLKTYIQATKTAQAAATALVQTNLNTAVSAQDTRDDGQDSAITAAAALGTTGIANAAAALAVAQGKLTKEVLTGSGNWTVPAGVTSVLVIAQGGGSCEAEYSADHWGVIWGNRNWSFYSEATAGELVSRVVAVSPGDSIAYVCGVGQQVHRDPSTGDVVTPCYMKSFIDAGDSYLYSSFDTVRARAAISRYAVNVGSIVSRADSYFNFSRHPTGKLPDTPISNAAYTPNVINQTVGKAGTITLLY
jgi:hypothetical protein